MIIKEVHKKNYSSIIFKMLLLILAVFLCYKLITTFSDKKNNKTNHIYCGMEKVKEGFYVSGNEKFGNGHTQSSDKSRTGRYSCLINKNQSYGTAYIIENVKAGDRICASIWRWSNLFDFGILAAQGNSGSEFNHQQSLPSETDENDWAKIELCIDIPVNEALSSVKIFPYSLQGEHFGYFDDLTIIHTKADSIKNAFVDLEIPALQLYIDSKGSKELYDAKERALRYGILFNDGNYSDARLSENDHAQNVKIRLKGDWTDHLEGSDWSYRVKTQKDQSWNRMQTFSLQNPKRRFYLKEWLFHNFLEREDVLTPRYDFVHLKINDKLNSLYTYEEHFDKHLPEYKNRREGVILKFTEDAVWERRLRSKKVFGDHEIDILDTKFNADIVPFKESRVVSDSSLLKQFISGQNLLYAYKHYTKPVDQIFDVNLLAKYYAIVDVVKAYHSVLWSNQRFYYNPVSQLLEPIGYDGFTEEAEYYITHLPCFGYHRSYKDAMPWSKYYNYIFRNEKFSKHYAYYLKKFSNKEYLLAYFDEIETALNQREKLIQVDFPEYELDRTAFFAKANKVAATLKAYDNISLKAFREKSLKDSIYLALSNYHYLPLEVLGSGLTSKMDKNKYPLNSKVLWSNLPSKIPEYSYLTIPKGHKFIYYRVLGLEDVHYSQIKNWPAGIATVEPNVFKSDKIPFDPNDISIEENSVTLKPGKYVLNEPLIITDKVLIIESGTEIDLINGAFIYCDHSLNWQGSKTNPILIKSSDKSGQGVLMLKAKEKSLLNHVAFKYLDNLDQGNYFMTGAVTFYESNVEINHCQFSNNMCEDALNIIRSEFKIDKMHLSDTYADGFDADFCKGTISNSYATHTGNDAFDFSGSTITIDNCIFETIGDKGISAGEEATVEIKSATINGAEIGVASKDLSKVTIENITVNNCNKAFAAYQKKPEYGPAKITIAKYAAEGNKFLEVKENNSKIIFPETVE